MKVLGVFVRQSQKISTSIEGRFNKTIIISAIIYGVKCWLMKKSKQSKVIEMHMIRWMYSLTLRDTIRNDHIKEALIIAPIEESE